MRTLLFIVLTVVFSNCSDVEVESSDLDLEEQSYLFIKSLVNQNTGLVESIENEEFTTVYKNALAAMAFTYQGDYAQAEKIFNFFNAKYNSENFLGFTQSWNPKTGEVIGEPNYWVGDGSFLLISLNYFRKTDGNSGKYQEMVNGLIDWLAKSGNENDNSLIAEGLIDIFAALKPFENSLPSTTPDVLLKLHSSFLNKASFNTVGDHIERAALTLGNINGFDYINEFKKEDVWIYNNKTINALSAFSTENFINTEISAQNLLAWKIWEDDLEGIDLTYIEEQLKIMRINGIKDKQSSGIPYLTQHPNNANLYSKPIIDPTCYMFFYYNEFNPMVPPREKCFNLDYDFIECEDISSQTGQGVKEQHFDAINDCTFQITQNNSSDSNELTYQINLHQSYSNPKISIRYSDDVAGNVLKVYIDDIFIGEFTTINTGGWNNFIWDESISAGNLLSGNHQIKLICSGGSYGVNLDIIKISN